MDVQNYWISKGRLVAWPGGDLNNLAEERRLISREGYVKIRISPEGLRITWDVNAPNWSSLYFAKEWLGAFVGPVRLTYFLYGWFDELIQDTREAASRIDHLIARSDIRLRSQVLVRDFEDIAPAAPVLPHRVYSDNRAPPEESVDCLFDEFTGRFKVTRIGAESAIARFWGRTTQVYPCQNGSIYDRVVSSIYAQVMNSGRPHYDQVVAAMPRPDGEVGWIPYHRVVVPQSAGSRRGVAVTTEFSPVDITVV